MTRLLISVLLALTCCTGDKKQVVDVEVMETKSQPDNDFIKFVSLLPKLSLPYETNCEICCEHPRLDYNNELIGKFRPEGTAIVGLIDISNDKVIILVTYAADVLVPSVKVYDLEGKLMGEKDFMTSYCGGDFEYYARQFLRITSDISFNSIDTSYFLKMDTVDYHVIDTTKIEIKMKEFIINSKGEFVENNAR